MIRAKIKLWDENKSPIAELIVPRDSSHMLDTDKFVSRCWEAADRLALILTPSDEWAMDMTISIDFTNEGAER